MESTHVLISNPCGALAAMPTIKEFAENEYILTGMKYGAVKVSPELAQLVYEQRRHVKVLAPGLPSQKEDNESVFVTVFAGELKYLGTRRPSIKIQKPVGFTSFLKRFFTRKV